MKKKKQTKISKISALRATFLKLDRELKEFGRTKCKFYGNRKDKKTGFLECHHSVMGWGGMNRNTNCELANCPRILCGDEGD